MNLDDFLNHKYRKNAWVNIPFGRIYMRRSKRYRGEALVPCLDLATIEIDEELRGRGVFTRFVNELLRMDMPEFDLVFVENVIEERFQQWFERNGWELARYECNSYFKSTMGTSLPIKRC